MNFDTSNQQFPADCKRFYSWSEFIEWTMAHRTADNGGIINRQRVSFMHPPTESWDASLGLDGAFQMAQSGWSDGMAKAEAIAAPMVEKIVGQMERPEIAYDVEGISLDIGRFLSDDPECWIKLETEIVSSPSVSPRLISIVHNCTESFGVRADEIIRKGAHVMALIQALEFAGHRVELTVLPYSTNAGFCAVTVKQFDQPLDTALAIYALAHPTVLRRLGFIYAENMSKAAQSEAGSRYGMPRNPVSDADIKVDSKVGYIDINWIIAELKKQGITLRAEA